MDMKCWSQDPPTTVGSWREEELMQTVGQRTYWSDWTPYDIDGEPSKLTHSGRYLKVWVGDKYLAFHQQLKQDDLGLAINGSRFHVHHKDDNPKNNELANLEVKTKSEHLKHHGADGGRPPSGRKRQWSAPRRR
jgi:hypothetical protein